MVDCEATFVIDSQVCLGRNLVDGAESCRSIVDVGVIDNLDIWSRCIWWHIHVGGNLYCSIAYNSCFGHIYNHGFDRWVYSLCRLRWNLLNPRWKNLWTDLVYLHQRLPGFVNVIPEVGFLHYNVRLKFHDLDKVLWLLWHSHHRNHLHRASHV